MELTRLGWLIGLLLVLSLSACGGGDYDDWGVEEGGFSAALKNGGIKIKPKASGTPAVSGSTSGIAVDPYLVGASFFEDVNGNGRLDAGEQISSLTDEQGRFSFAAPVVAGRTIIMYDRGLHQGVPFTGRLMRRVKEGDPQTLVVSPLTTMDALGLPPAELAAPLTLLNNPLGTEYDLDADPMAGLSGIIYGDPQEWAAIIGLRANLYLGTVLDLYLLNREISEIRAGDLDLLLHTWEPLYDLMDGLRYAVSAETISRITSQLPAGLPPVTMREVAEAAPALLNWWKQEIMRQVIAGEPVSITAQTLMAKVDSVLPGLALRYYVRNRASEPAVQQAVASGHLPPAEADHYTLEKSGAIVAANQTIRKEHLVGQMFALGEQSRLRFFNGSTENQGLAELAFPINGVATKLTGTWRIENNVLTLQGADSDRILQLELEIDWTSHLSLRIKGEAPTDLAPATFLGRLLEESGYLRIAG